MDASLLPDPDLRLVSERVGEAIMDNTSYNDLADEIREIEHALTRLYGPPIGVGAYRRVWANGEAVYKIPNADYDLDDGIYCNLWEVRDAQEHYGELTVASCRLVWHEAGIPIVVMETVLPAVEADTATMPRAAQFVDGNQLGRTQDTNEWVVYDAGNPLNANWHWGVRHAAVPPIFAA